MKRSGPTRDARQANRQAMESALRSKRLQVREQLKKRRKPPRESSAEKRRRRLLMVALAILIILLLLMQDCSCSPPPEPVEEGPASSVQVVVEPAEPLPPLPTERIARRDRPEFAGKPPEPLPWLDLFRMQVAARSPRLAECFVGAQRPGRLKWTTAVEPIQGRVSEHVLEPMLLSDALNRQERACVLGVLSDPPYRLSTEGEGSTPSRVGIVIEF